MGGHILEGYYMPRQKATQTNCLTSLAVTPIMKWLPPEDICFGGNSLTGWPNGR